MKRESLVRRLATMHQLLAAALITAFAASAIGVAEHTLGLQEAAFLDHTVQHMVLSLRQEWDEVHDWSIAAHDALVESVPLGVRIDVLDDRGRVLGSTGGNMGGDPRTQRATVAPGVQVVATMSTRPRREAVKALGLALLLTAVPLFVATSLLGRWLSRRALVPLSRMASQAELTTSHQAVRSLGSPGDPAEVALLAASFDRLIARLDGMIRAERQFTQDAAHELRTPLTVLTGEIEHARSNLALPPGPREALARAAHQTRAMSELVEALLFLRRADEDGAGRPADLAPVNLADVVRDAVRELVPPAHEREADVTVDADDEVLVAGHPVLLASALRNLVTNALKFTTSGQPVRITVHAGEDPCRVVVEDGGEGIDAADRESIFAPFYRGAEARARHDGFGIGLAILRRVARAHGGDVEATESTLGGARFDVRLPTWKPL